MASPRAVARTPMTQRDRDAAKDSEQLTEEDRYVTSIIYRKVSLKTPQIKKINKKMVGVEGGAASRTDTHPSVSISRHCVSPVGFPWRYEQVGFLTS